MKIKGLFVLAGVMAVMLSSCGKTAVSSAKMKNSIDSLSYAFGIYNYNMVSYDSLVLNPWLIAKAFVDGEKEKPKMSDEIARGYIQMFFQRREQEQYVKQAEEYRKQAEANKVLYKDYIVQNEEFLAKNKERKGVIVTPSGLQYEVIKMGTGKIPTADSEVKVHYVGTLIDGTQFDSSVEKNEPVTFRVSEVISGWNEALQLMPVGSKFKLYIPENIAYGGNERDSIKPFSTLIFEMELLEIVE